MAKLKAPLMSLGASGQLGKALVFFPWKGLDVVREYVVPSNPKTALQLTQRGYVTAAVALIHTAMADATNPLGQVDQTAYATLAAAKGIIMTWFNQAVKLCVNAVVAGFGQVIYTNGTLQSADKDDFRPVARLTEAAGITIAAGKFYLGTSKTNLYLSEVATIVANTSASLTIGNGFSGLTAGVKYYWQFRPDTADPAEGCDSGIYSGVAT